MRKITVVSTNTDQVFEIESSAETWGELSRHERIGGASNMKAMIRETKNSLESEQAILPQGDFTLYLSPSKVKSGFSTQDLEDIEEIIEALEDSGSGKHLIRFMERLKNGNSIPSVNGTSTELPVLRNNLIPDQSRNREMLDEAKRLLK